MIQLFINAQNFPEKIAIIDRGKPKTYDELWTASGKIAQYLINKKTQHQRY
jgi:acyl-CoA synthetase (AMP-forming)/AMP-acid ligase II